MRRILYVQYTNPGCYPPLEHSSQILAERGWQVRFVGIEVPGTEKMTFPPHPNIDVRLMAWQPGVATEATFCEILPLGCGHGIVVAAALDLRVGDARVSRGLAGGAIVAARGGVSRARQSVIAECESLYALVPENAGPVSAAGRTLRLAQCGADTAFLRADRAQRVQCVWNVPTRNEVGERTRDASEDVWLLYVGSITPTLLPLHIMDALATAGDSVRLRVIGYETVGHPGYVQELRAHAERKGVGARIEFLGTLPRHRIFEWCRRSDIGLALLARTGLEPMAGASNKPFDYLSGGCALLISDTPEFRATFVEPGYAHACDPADVASIGSALQRYVAHRDEMRAMGAAGRERILREWNYETQFAPVLRILESDCP